MGIDEEIEQLKTEIKRLAGSNSVDGHPAVKFGIIVRDDRCSNIFEALVGTLKAAKRREVIAYNSELLLQGAHDDIDIVLLAE
ncbi:hypothetical protein FRC14_005945 [Serendipita sp. 396]|nr:hypothetical protein FRC14_005945 [Serendipita sp. 396]KAG8779802.1 hypothetical protein FRC15_009930 [Serendipita sp. 397]KAG8796866.1 hypothetical protein FRC16_009442 [Serendipita sp. 398]KAG8814223.1 hypothetical protein FRC18_002052 [Serendipita sp. 400]KAG8828475.1 hypothetical protein FRC19_003814 [Serendipita sp. 401]KAG8860470.1 hypothetical protein FRB91_002820 [Serendipita sp. 411]KAG8864722.1 hypothetical protein FRC20_010103 [Serendipita sp. 405]KAG9058118.1 hypothetical prot